MMSPKFWLAPMLICAVIEPEAASLDGLNEAAGVNQTLEEGFGARHSGMGITFAGFQTDANAVANSPAAMNDIDDFTFSSAHAEKFGEAKFDDFAFLFPFEANSTFGFGIARYGVTGIENRPEDYPALNSQPQGLFSIADYLMMAGFARRWGGLDVGMNFNMLYRQLDQDGMGMRADGMAQYTWSGRYRVGALLKGLIPSSATWASGYKEYESPDLYLGAAALIPAPYFYGTLQVAVQTEGLFQGQAKSARELNGSRVYESFGDAVSAGNLGLEYLFDFGLALRCGLSEIAFDKSTGSSATFGIGYNWRKILAVDYSFTPHPDLLSSHRVSLEFTPSFPKFEGRDFRGHGHGRKAVSQPATITPSPQSESQPAAPSPQSEKQPAAPTQGSAPAHEAAPEPQAAPKATPEPANGDKEILEKDDEGQ